MSRAPCRAASSPIARNLPPDRPAAPPGPGRALPDPPKSARCRRLTPRPGARCSPFPPLRLRLPSVRSQARPAARVGWNRQESLRAIGLGAFVLALGCQTTISETPPLPPTSANTAGSETVLDLRAQGKPERDQPQEEAWLDGKTAQAEA